MAFISCHFPAFFGHAKPIKEKGEMLVKTKTVLSAVGGAMAAGACAMLVGAAVSTPSMKKMYKKKANKALRHVAGMIDDVQDLLK